MPNRTKDDNRELRIDKPNQSIVLPARVKHYERVDAFASSQIKISIAPGVGFDSLDQQFVPARVTDSAHAEHKRRSKRINAHQISMCKHQAKCSAPSAYQGLSRRVWDIPKNLCHLKHASLSLGTDACAFGIIQNE